MNWKRAGVILVTLGVTATVGYVSYTYVTSAKSKDIKDFLENNKESDIVKGLSDENKENAIKNATNISKKELVKLIGFCKKKVLSDEDKSEMKKILSKLKIEK
jgi:hypothetical protein